MSGQLCTLCPPGFHTCTGPREVSAYIFSDPSDASSTTNGPLPPHLQGSPALQVHTTTKFRKIIGALALVLGIYMLLFLPFCIRNLYCLVAISHHYTCHNNLSLVATSALLYLSPLADPLLYIFMRRDVRNSLNTSLCHRGLLRQVVCNESARPEEELRQTAESSVRQTQNMGNSLHDTD